MFEGALGGAFGLGEGKGKGAGGRKEGEGEGKERVDEGRVWIVCQKLHVSMTSV